MSERSNFTKTPITDERREAGRGGLHGEDDGLLDRLDFIAGSYQLKRRPPDVAPAPHRGHHRHLLQVRRPELGRSQRPAPDRIRLVELNDRYAGWEAWPNSVPAANQASPESARAVTPRARAEPAPAVTLPKPCRACGRRRGLLFVWRRIVQSTIAALNGFESGTGHTAWMRISRCDGNPGRLGVKRHLR